MGKTGKEKTVADADRKERLAAELRANLKRRKARARDAGTAQGQEPESPDTADRR